MARYLLRLLGAGIFSGLAGFLLSPLVAATGLWPACAIAVLLFVLTGLLVGATNSNRLALVVSAICAVWSFAFVYLAAPSMTLQSLYLPVVAFSGVFWITGVVGTIMSISAIKHHVAVPVGGISGFLNKLLYAGVSVVIFAAVATVTEQLAVRGLISLKSAAVATAIEFSIVVVGVVVWLMMSIFRPRNGAAH